MKRLTSPGSWFNADQAEELGKYQAVITLEDTSLTPLKKSLLIYQAIKNPETSEALLPDLSKQVASGNHKNEQAVLRKKD